MTESDLPQGTATGEAMSIDEVDTALEQMIDDPALGLIDDDEIQQNEAEPETDEGEELEEVEGEVDDDDEDESEESEAETEQDTVELEDDIEIDLGDGQKATLSDLKRDYGQVQKREQDMQRDYTQKQMALSDERKKFETDSAEFINWADQLEQHQALLNNLQSQFLREPPIELMDTDPMEYMRQKEFYNQTVNLAQNAQQSLNANKQAMVQMNHKKMVEAYKTEVEAFQSKNPQYAGDNFKKFEDQVLTTFKDTYGFSKEELQSGINNSKIMEVVRDAMAYRQIKASTGKVKAKVKGKPPVLKSGKSKSKSNSPSAELAKRKARFAKSGSSDDFEALLMDYDI